MANEHALKGVVQVLIDNQLYNAGLVIALAIVLAGVAICVQALAHREEGSAGPPRPIPDGHATLLERLQRLEVEMDACSMLLDRLKHPGALKVGAPTDRD